MTNHAKIGRIRKTAWNEGFKAGVRAVEERLFQEVEDDDGENCRFEQHLEEAVEIVRTVQPPAPKAKKKA